MYPLYLSGTVTTVVGLGRKGIIVKTYSTIVSAGT